MTLQLEQVTQQILEEFETGRLVVPSLPEVVTRIRQAINDKNRGTRYIARLIQFDPGLTARLIQIANSPAYRGPFPIDTCQMAITRLGLRTTRNLVTCLVMHNIFNLDSPKIHRRTRELWKQSCKVAAIANVLAQVNKGQVDPDKALLAGLVHDIGVLPVLYYAADVPELLEHTSMLETLIQELSGRLGREILLRWKFDPELIEVPGHVDDWRYAGGDKIDYVDIVIIARIHSRFGSVSSVGVPPLVELPAFQKMSIATLGPDASLELLYEARSEIQGMMQMLLQ